MSKALVSDASVELFACGKWTKSASRSPVVDKFSGAVVGEVASASAADVARAVAACAEAFRAGPPPPHKRADILHRASQLVADRAPSLAATIVAESGFTHADANGEVSRCVQTLIASAAEARRFDEGEVVPLSGAPGQEGRLGFTLRVPIGPVAAITPFNSPLNTVAHKLAPAFAAGNPVLLKPSGYTPLTAALLVQVLLDAGVPENFIAYLPGSGGVVGPALLAQQAVRFFTFTGSTEVGRRIQTAAGLRRTQLELGSIAFTIVMPDADLDRAIPLIASASFRKAGQVCTSIQVLLVHGSIRDEVEQRLADQTRSMPCGDNRKPETVVGPMIAEQEAERAQDWVTRAREAGARAVLGGERSGSLLQPTILANVPVDALVLTDEIFAPVVSIVPFSSFETAIDSVNATPYGLATGVFTRDIERALQAARALHVGGVHINNTCSSRVDLMPYGGVKDSGFGREGPRYAMREMSEERLVTITP
jgi:succinate-semialdehyde dehydrogenase/glutarate-semialdehyde dehydrogenase